MLRQAAAREISIDDAHLRGRPRLYPKRSLFSLTLANA